MAFASAGSAANGTGTHDGPRSLAAEAHPRETASAKNKENAVPDALTETTELRAQRKRIVAED